MFLFVAVAEIAAAAPELDAGAALAAKPDANVRVSRRSDGTVTFLGATVARPLPETIPFSRPEDRARGFLQSNRGLFVSAGTALELTAAHVVESDDLGLSQVRLRQSVAGIPVRGAEAIVHLTETGVTAVNSALVSIDPPAAAPVVDANYARQTALAAVMARLGPVEATAAEPQLEYFDPNSGGSAPLAPRLMWYVEVYGPGLLQQVWIDASSGAVALVLNRLLDALNRRTFDMQNSSAIPGTPARSEGQGPSAVTDVNNAHDLAGDFYNYFLTQHGRDSYNGAGAVIESFVRYCATVTAQTCPYRNAFWDSRVRQIFYGAGMAVDDIVGHELTHAVIDTSADLIYLRESGALNESYADIFGETIDLTNGRGNDGANVRWQVGEEVAAFFGGPIRNMSDPGARGDPARVKDANYYCLDGDNGGVHINSGVPNHAYALMVDGGAYNGYTVSAIGLTKAAKIQYRALTSYLVSSSNFLANFNALIQSCGDLIGTAGITHDDCSQVKKALLAVEMSTPPCTNAVPPAAPPAAPDALGAAPPLCPVGQVATPVFADDFENTASGKWTTGALAGTNHWLGGVGIPAIHATGNAAGGTYAAHATTGATAADSVIAMANSVAVPPNAWLNFESTSEFDSGFDGVVVEYSTNNGNSWQSAAALFSAGRGYDAGLANGTGNPLGGRVAFSGHAPAYSATRLNLATLAGSSVRFRFRAATDSSIAAPGFWVDNVSLYTCAMPVTGISITPSSGLQTTEGGGTATFTVVLQGAPAANVTIALSSSDTSEGTVSPAVLTFTPANWNVAQTVTVTGVNDSVVDGSVAYTIITAPAVSGDPNYSGMNAVDVAVTNADDDAASNVQPAQPLPRLILSGTAGLTTSESGGRASFAVKLSQLPIADVTIRVSSSNLAEGTVSPRQLVFTPQNFGQPQTVTVTGRDDDKVDGDVRFRVVLGKPNSADTNFAAMSALEVDVVNQDDDANTRAAASGLEWLWLLIPAAVRAERWKNIRRRRFLR